jgi:hypothetical protein
MFAVSCVEGTVAFNWLAQTREWSAPGAEQQEAAGDRDVLEQHDLLHLVGTAVEDETGGEREHREAGCGEARAEADDHGNGADDLQRDHQRQQGARHAHGLHVALRSGIARDLADAAQQEHGREQDAAGEVSGIFPSLHGSMSFGVSTVSLRVKRRTGSSDTILHLSN